MTNIACTVISVASGKYSNLLIVLLIVPELNMYVWLLLFGGGRCFHEKMFLKLKKIQMLLQTSQLLILCLWDHASSL